jgi:long-chain acyl-CoA synthetase
MFNCGGENIYPKEVENLLLSHSDVYDASVVAVAQPVKGYVPVAMVMRAKGSAITEEELKRYCLDNGPAYAHPRRIRIVEEMPLNSAAKVDRTKIQQLLEEAFAEELARAQ